MCAAWRSKTNGRVRRAISRGKESARSKTAARKPTPWWPTHLQMSVTRMKPKNGDKRQTNKRQKSRKPNDSLPGTVALQQGGNWAPVRGIAFTADARRVLTGSLDGTVRLWDAPTGKQIAMYCGHRDGIRGISLSPDGRRVLSAGMDNIACMWNVDSTEVPTVDLNLRSRLSPAVGVSTDGRTLLCANSTKVTLYDCATLHPLRNYALDSPASFVAFLPDNASFITSSPTVVRDLRSGKVLRSYPDRDPCRIASNGRVALSIEKNKATVWDPVTGKTIGQHPAGG